MSRKPRRVILVGWDGAVPDMADAMVEKGLLANFRALVARGSYYHALNPFPTITAPNWTTLATGAMPGTHGITCYSVHHPGEDLDKIHTGFNTAECSTEYIWDAAERVGKKSILLKYEASWPPTLKSGVVVDGCGPNWSDEFHRIAQPQIFSSEEYPRGLLLDLEEDGKGNLTGAMPIEVDGGDPVEYRLTYSPGPGRAVVKTHNGETVADLAKGDWSGTIEGTFDAAGGPIQGTFRLKLLEAPEADGGAFTIFATEVFPKSGWTYPDRLGPELIEHLGHYSPRAGWGAHAFVPHEMYLELMDYQHEWLGKAANYLCGRFDWQILYTQTHAHDYSHHIYMRGYDPLTSELVNAKQERHERYMDHTYESADRFLGEVLRCADDDTLVILASDHGAITWHHDVPVADILEKAGLLVREGGWAPGRRVGKVAWEKTKALPQRSCYIYLNLKGRDPHGIVEPRDYDRTCQEIRELLYSYRHPATGENPFSLVVTREEARLLGLYGERVGDIVYAVRGGYGHEHGQQLPTTKYGRGSLESVLVLAGPGIKKGVRREQTLVGIQGVVPTICYLLDIPFPRGCDGAIIYDALET